MKFALNIFLCSWLIFLSGFCEANNQDFGIGAIVGDPTGLSLKLNLNHSHAIDAALAWSSSGTHIHSNYLWTFENYLRPGQAEIDLYYGVGARFIAISSGSDKDKTSFGPRAPVGLNYHLMQTPFQIFIEAAINLDIAPRSAVDVDAGLGLRFHF